MGSGDGVVGQADRNGQEVGMHGKEWIGFEDWVIRNDYPTEKNRAYRPTARAHCGGSRNSRKCTKGF